MKWTAVSNCLPCRSLLQDIITNTNKTNNSHMKMLSSTITKRLDYCNSLLYGISDNLYRGLQAFKMPQHASSPTREGASTSRPSCSSYIASSPPICSIQDRHAGVQGTAQPLACIPGGRLPTCVCHRHVPSAANQHTFWRSLIHCCWTSSMEQSANPAARVRHYIRTIFDKHSKRIYLVTDSCSTE